MNGSNLAVGAGAMLAGAVICAWPVLQDRPRAATDAAQITALEAQQQALSFELRHLPQAPTIPPPHVTWDRLLPRIELFSITWAPTEPPADARAVTAAWWVSARGNVPAVLALLRTLDANPYVGVYSYAQTDSSADLTFFILGEEQNK